MSSKILYPPIVDSYMPAFEVVPNGESVCNIYFKLSNFNSKTDFSSVQATVVKQDTNMNVVKKEDGEIIGAETDATIKRYRSTGIILNLKPKQVLTETNLFYIQISSNDLSSKSDNYEGWIPDWIYKIQLRLSEVDYDESTKQGQSEWLNANAGKFSEWSTICVVKAIRHITYTLDALNIDTENANESLNNRTVATLYSSTLVASGKFKNFGSEDIYKYNFILYDMNDVILENSGDIYANRFQDNKSFNYLFKRELKNGNTYKLEFKFETINHFVGGAYRRIANDGEVIDKRYEFIASVLEIGNVDCLLATAENDYIDKETANRTIADITSVHDEEEDGRIGIKLYSQGDNPFSGNLCLRRADSKDNFQTWTDIKIFILKAQTINSLPIYYDYTAESGVWYQYGVQRIDKEGFRGEMNVIPPIIRNYNYSYLLGKNNQQLKLMFDNTMGNFKIQVAEAKNDPIGATYPIVTRNAATRYRTFPINGLISFWMDENKTFCDKKVIYTYDDIVNKYNKYNEEQGLMGKDDDGSYHYTSPYDYIYERDFRKLVLDFLYDGEFKLFKSPTEGNIIVRLMDISCVPNQSLDRMIYSFTSNAHEMAEATMENYKTYEFYDPGEYGTDFSTTETRLGQIQKDFPVNTDINTDIIAEIVNKYDSKGKNVGGYSRIVEKIHHVKISFEDKPLRIRNNANNSNNNIVLGNNILLGDDNLITIYAPNRFYEFVDNYLFIPGVDTLKLLGDAQGLVKTVRVTVDFLYDMRVEVYQEKEIQQKTIQSGIGQVFKECTPNENIYNNIYYKYYIEGAKVFRRLTTLTSIEIEANPGTIIYIKDQADYSQGENHVVNETGTLRFNDLSNISDIKYIGTLDDEGNIFQENADILINYEYAVTKGEYRDTSS